MSKPLAPFKTATQLGITEDEREGLLAVALLLPTIKHTPYPFKHQHAYPPYPRLRTFDMSHVRYRGAGCVKAWMAELGYLDGDAFNEEFSDALFFLFYPRAHAIEYASITPVVAAGAIYAYLRSGCALSAYA